MLVDVTEYRTPNGERIERQAEVDDAHEPLIEALNGMGFSFAYEGNVMGREVLYITHREGDYRTMFLKREHGNAAGATTAILADVSVEDARRWLDRIEAGDGPDDEDPNNTFRDDDFAGFAENH